jgi:hypothetical protein
MSFLGHPSTREEEDTCFIATSYDLDCERLDWESTAIVAWVIAAPSGMDRSDVEDVFRRKFRLRASELMVSAHFPEQFLVKFSSVEIREEVMRTERCNFKMDGLDVHFRPWRAVSHAYNADLHFRVHVVVDGLPPFAWRPEVVDQLVGRKCAVQRLDDGFTTMEDTSSFGLWAWTPSPHRIPKVLWCTLVNKGEGGLSSKVRIEEDRPDQWKRGVSFRVLLHVDCVEDYTAAPILDGGEPISSFKPTVHSLPRCHLGTIDGRPVDVGSGSILPAPIPALGELGPAFNQLPRKTSSAYVALAPGRMIDVRRVAPFPGPGHIVALALRSLRIAAEAALAWNLAAMIGSCANATTGRTTTTKIEGNLAASPHAAPLPAPSAPSLQDIIAAAERDAPTGMGPTVLQAVATATDVTSSKNMVPQPSPWFGRSSPPSSHATRTARIGLPPSRSCRRLLPGGSRVWPRPPSSAAAAVPPQLLDG